MDGLGDGPGRLRHDDFVRPPSFHDGLSSRPLDPVAAKWSRRGSASIALGSIAAGLGVAIAIALMVMVAPASAPDGASSGIEGAAAEGPDSDPALSIPDPQVDPQSVIGNITSSASASPPAPPLPP